MQSILCCSLIVLSTVIIGINGHVDSSPPPADADGVHHQGFLRQNLQLVNTLLKSINGSRRLQQSDDCTPPQFGCGHGLWNDKSCECDCLPVSIVTVAVAFSALYAFVGVIIIDNLSALTYFI